MWGLDLFHVVVPQYCCLVRNDAITNTVVFKYFLLWPPRFSRITFGVCSHCLLYITRSRCDKNPIHTKKKRRKKKRKIIVIIFSSLLCKLPLSWLFSLQYQFVLIYNIFPFKKIWDFFFLSSIEYRCTALPLCCVSLTSASSERGSFPSQWKGMRSRGDEKYTVNRNGKTHVSLFLYWSHRQHDLYERHEWKERPSSLVTF